MVAFTNEHLEIPVFLISMYLIVVFYLPSTFAKPFKLKPLMILWNMTLSLFSIIGVIRVFPTLYALYTEKGLIDSVCHNGTTPAWFDGPTGLWMFFFIYSKLFELIDTVFLVLGKKPVIFLHWFHHVTVLLFCWQSFAIVASPGIFFACMNFFVHSIMYSYYFLMFFTPLRPILKLIAPFITTIQILQMVGGLIISVITAQEMMAGHPCKVTTSNWKLGLAMYLSYFVLFSALFYAKYIAPMCKSKSTSAVAPGSVCNATDSAGMFRGASSSTNLAAMAQKPKNE